MVKDAIPGDSGEYKCKVDNEAVLAKLTVRANEGLQCKLNCYKNIFTESYILQMFGVLWFQEIGPLI